MPSMKDFVQTYKRVCNYIVPIKQTDLLNIPRLFYLSR